MKMTDVMIDLTSRPHKRYQINRCHYCDHDKYPEGKPIDPTTDKNSRQMRDGSWKCSTCLTHDMLFSIWCWNTKEIAMPAHYQPFYCSLCREHIGNIVCRTVGDIKEIHTVCYNMGSGMACNSCLAKLKNADN